MSMFEAFGICGVIGVAFFLAMLVVMKRGEGE